MESSKILFQFLINNKFNDFKKFIENNDSIELNLRDEYGNYLITYAIIKNNINIIKILLTKGCRIDIVDQDGRSLIYLPIKYKYDDVVKLLIEFNEHIIGISLVDFKDSFGNIPLHYGILFKNIQAIDLLLNSNSNPNITDNNNNNSLHLAIYSKNYDICKKIINKDININLKNYIGETALHIACNLQLINIVKLLLDNGIDVNSQDYNNEITALTYAININDKNIAKILLNYGANPNIQDFMGNTPIHYIILEENFEILFEILKSDIKIKPNFNIFNINGKLPIHLLLEKDKIYDGPMTDELIFASNLNFQDKYGTTTLHLICKKNIWELFKHVLIKKKLNIFIKNHENIMPINYIEKNKINNFIDMVSQSYLYILKNYNFSWQYEWENLCGKKKLNDDDVNILKKYVNHTDNKNKDICYKIIYDKLFDIYNNKNNNKNYSCESFPKKKFSKCIKIDNFSNLSTIEFCTFVGIAIDILIGLIFLLKKHKYSCSTLSTNFIINNDLSNYYAKIGVKTNPKCEFLNFEIVWIYKKLFFSDNFVNNFVKCVNNTNIRFIIIPLGIEIKEGNHANYLIFDKKTFELERFEPYGSSEPYKFNYNGKLLDSILTFKFNEIYDNIKYISPDKFLPKIGFQYNDVFEYKTKKLGDPDGFCSLWSIWYCDMRLSHPDIHRNSLINKLLKKIKESNISFKNLIRNYSQNITNIRDEIFKKVDITINNWINDQYSEKQYQNIISEIKTLLNNCLS